MGTSKTVMCSLTHLRPLTCAASASASRIVPYPPDLLKWVTREGGFVHRALDIAQLGSSNGLGLVAKDPIPRGSDLIVLPHHLPLRFTTLEHDPLLHHLARQIPGIHSLSTESRVVSDPCFFFFYRVFDVNELDTVVAFDRGTMGNETGFEASAREGKSWVLLVAVH